MFYYNNRLMTRDHRLNLSPMTHPYQNHHLPIFYDSRYPGFTPPYGGIQPGNTYYGQSPFVTLGNGWNSWGNPSSISPGQTGWGNPSGTPWSSFGGGTFGPYGAGSWGSSESFNPVNPSGTPLSIFGGGTFEPYSSDSWEPSNSFNPYTSPNAPYGPNMYQPPSTPPQTSVPSSCQATGTCSQQVPQIPPYPVNIYYPPFHPGSKAISTSAPEG